MRSNAAESNIYISPPFKRPLPQKAIPLFRPDFKCIEIVKYYKTVTLKWPLLKGHSFISDGVVLQEVDYSTTVVIVIMVTLFFKIFYCVFLMFWEFMVMLVMMAWILWCLIYLLTELTMGAMQDWLSPEFSNFLNHLYHYHESMSSLDQQRIQTMYMMLSHSAELLCHCCQWSKSYSSHLLLCPANKLFDTCPETLEQITIYQSDNNQHWPRF